MPNFNRRLLVVAALGALALAGCSKSGGAGSVDTADMTLGDPNAKVKIVEYASLTCSHCGKFNNEVFPEFKKKYIDTGKVHYTFKEFLTPPNEVAAAGFLTARCAGKDKYFNVTDAIFHAQEEMFVILEGSGTLRVAGEHVPIGAGDVITVPPFAATKDTVAQIRPEQRW